MNFKSPKEINEEYNQITDEMVESLNDNPLDPFGHCSFDEKGLKIEVKRDKGIHNSPLRKQEGGDHYKRLQIQPVEYITHNHLGFIEGCIIKYATRHRYKNGAEDIKKIIHFAELLLVLEYNENI